MKAPFPFSQYLFYFLYSQPKTDTQRNAAEIITIIFRRWIQENDFKYLQKHYGINQIISYDTIDYKKFAETLTDKKVTSGTYKALQYDKAQQEKRLKDLLLKKHLRDMINTIRIFTGVEKKRSTVFYCNLNY